MTTLMTAPYRTVALDRRMFAVHAKPSAHGPQSTQGGCSTPLTPFAALSLMNVTGDQALIQLTLPTVVAGALVIFVTAFLLGLWCDWMWRRYRGPRGR